jgi:hypothetical protein
MTILILGEPSAATLDIEEALSTVRDQREGVGRRTGQANEAVLGCMSRVF